MTGIVAALLAAGTSSRTAPTHKLLARDSGGTAMLARTARNLLASRKLAHVFVLLPPQGTAFTEQLTALLPQSHRLSAHSVLSGRHELSATVGRAAALAISRHAAALLIQPGDMPLVEPDTADRMISLFREDNTTDVVVPVCSGNQGNPVLWNARIFPDLMRLTGDRGAKALLRRPDIICRSVQADETVLTDFDTPDRLQDFASL